MRVTDRQVRKFFMEYHKSGRIQMAAMKAGMNRDTAAAYLASGQLPSERVVERNWRTRPDPFRAHWAEAEAMLREAPELEAKALFGWLSERYAGQYDEGQLRSFQRHVRRWRALYGPEKEVYFPQEHRPGVRMETDFTCLNSLEITLHGEPYEQWLCHSVLTYSNWQWGTLCLSESLLALRKGLQAALVQLGHVPAEHWTDHTTAATHEVSGDEQGRRGFNANYLKLVEHFGLQPHTINRAEPHENGDIESANGALKRRLQQHLLLRGSRDFDAADAVRRFIEEVFHKANRGRQKRLAEELAVMRPLRVALLPEYVEEDVPVSRWSTVQTDRRIYSVPSRLIGETLRVRRYEERVEVYLAGVRQLVMPRLTGEKTHAINYRDIIEWLIRKPGAFAQYRFRADLFPSLAFRRAYDRLCQDCAPRAADLDYLRILRQAARTMESEVERVLLELEGRNLTPRWAVLQEFWPPTQPTAAPDLQPLTVELGAYDALLAEVQS
jgi:hypothetical protein